MHCVLNNALLQRREQLKNGGDTCHQALANGAARGTDARDALVSPGGEPGSMEATLGGDLELGRRDHLVG